MTPLAPRAAYDRWAARYAQDGRNPLTDLAADLVQRTLPVVSGRRIGDLGCGTGRWMEVLARLGAEPLGIDFSGPMLAAAAAAAGAGQRLLVAGDLSALPLGARSLDGALMVLSLSHLPMPETAFDEAARVLVPGGWLLVVDLHPTAAARGWRRSFRGERGERLTVGWYPHLGRRLRRAAGRAGLRVERWEEASLDPARLPAGAPSSATAGPALYALLLRQARGAGRAQPPNRSG